MYHEHYFEDERDPDMEPVIYSGALNHIHHHLKAVLDELYSDGPIDLCVLENSLDEVTNGLGMRLPNNELLIQRKLKDDTKLCQMKFDTELCQEAIA